ncbi:MAG: TSUP family transporter, partial [Campylobacterota bacterium]|nr:TSUP family transporter [Campylobacterota bacterium]
MYNIELFTLFGISTGFMAGFFGVGGGMVLVPMLLISGYSIKSAISISIIQMVYTSIFGTIINYKKNRYILKDGLFLGLGGFLGGGLSGFIISGIDGIYLKYAFLSLVIFAILRIYFSRIKEAKEKKEYNKLVLIILGFFIGLIAMS